MKKEFTKRAGSVLKPVLIGGTMGAGLALLLTPKSGKAIRKDLNRFAAQTRDQVSDVLDKGVDIYGDAKEAVAKAVDAGRVTFEGFAGRKRQSLVVPIIASGIIGAGVALLLAPKTGREMRKDIGRLAATTWDKSKDLYAEGRDAVSGAIEAGKKVYHDGRERLRRAA